MSARPIRDWLIEHGVIVPADMVPLRRIDTGDAECLRLDAVGRAEARREMATVSRGPLRHFRFVRPPHEDPP